MDYHAYKADISGKVGNDRDWPRCRSSVRSAVTFLLEDSITVKRSIGLLGYSQGSLLAISVASSIPQVKGVVEFFGSGGSDKEELKSNIRNFPPLLILHGEAYANDSFHRMIDFFRRKL